MSNQKRNRTLVLFVFVSLATFAVLVNQLGMFGGQHVARYHLYCDDVAGLVPKNAVKIAGVRIGQIESIEVEHRRAKMLLALDSSIVIHQDAAAIVRAKSLLGEKYLELDPGEQDAERLGEGEEIRVVRSSFEIDELVNALEPVVGGDRSLVDSIAPLLQQVESILKLAGGESGEAPLVTRAELRQMKDDLKISLAGVRRMVENNEPKITRTVDRLDQLSHDPRIDRSLKSLDRMTGDVAQRIPELLDQAETALTRIDGIGASAESLLSRSNLDRLEGSLEDSRVVAARLRSFSEELKGFSSEIRPLLKNLRLLSERAKTVDELALRRFLQEQGIKVRVGRVRSAEDRVRELEEQAP